MIHRSKKDLWLVLLVETVIALPFFLALYNLIAENGNAEAGWYLLFVASLILAITLWVTYPLNYEITDSSLIIRSGMIRTKIPLSAIVAVYPTNSLLSAPTWSLDRLRINYERDDGTIAFALVSPENKVAFLEDLTANSDGLELSKAGIKRVESVEARNLLSDEMRSVVQAEDTTSFQSTNELTKGKLRQKRG